MRLILLPGMDGTGDLFEPLLKSLGESANITVVRFPANQALDYLGLEVIARAALPVSEPFVLLGESFSGPIAISIAASAPEGLKGVVLCSTFARNPRPELFFLRWLTRILPMSLVPIRLMSFFLMGSFSSRKLRLMLAGALAQVDDRVMQTRVRSVLTLDVCSKLKEVKVPCLYLHGTHDRLVPRSAPTLIARHLPNLRLDLFDAPHFLLQAQPGRAGQVLSEFMRELDERAVTS